MKSPRTQGSTVPDAAPPGPKQIDTRPSVHRIAAALFVLLVAVYVLTVNVFFAGYGFETYLATEGLFLQRSYSLSNEDVRQINGFDIKNPCPEGARETRPPLQSFLQLPFYAAGWTSDQVLFRGTEKHARVLFVLSFSSVATALQAVVLLYLLVGMGRSLRRSVVFALLYGLTSMAFPYSSLGLDSLLVLAVLATYYALFRYAQSGSARYALAAGAAGAALVLTKTYGALFAVPLGVYLLAGCWFLTTGKKMGARLRASMRPALYFGLPVLAGFALLLADNYLKRGGLTDTGYGAMRYGLGYLPRNLFAMVAGSGSSVLLYNPVAILAIPAFAAFARRHMAEAFGVGALIAVCGIYFGSLAPPMTVHDEVYGPRYLLPVVPFLFVVASFFPLERFRQYLAVGCLALAGLCIQLVMKPVYYAMHTLLLMRLLAYNQDNADFVPALSPVAVNWQLVKSVWSRLFGDGQSLMLTYSPGFLPHLDPNYPVMSRTVSLAGYDVLDLYWYWAYKHYPLGATVCLVLLALAAGGAVFYLHRWLRDRVQVTSQELVPPSEQG